MASLSVIFGVNDAELQAAIKRARRGLKDMGGELRTAATDIAKWGAAVVSAGAAISAYMVKGAIDAADAQAKLAQSVHTSFNSMTTLEIAGARAGVSMEEVSKGAEKLDLTLGKAAMMADQGAAAALKRLGLEARELQAMPLDQRISTINDALARNIPLTEQAAVAGEIFGDKMQATMRKLSSDEIRQAAKDAEFFGLALSAVDAKKLEMSSDAFDEMDLAVKGVWRTVAVELAPMIVVLWKEIKKAAEEAGGFGKVATNAFESAMDAAGFVADAVSGISRVFHTVSDVIVHIMTGVARDVSYITFHMLDALNNIPGIDFSDAVASVRRFNLDMVGVVNEAVSSVDAALSKELPSHAFKKWAEDAKKATSEAAAAMVQQDTTSAEASKNAQNGMSEEYRKSLQTRLDALREHLSSKEELSFEQNAKELKQIAEFEKSKLINAQDAQLMREEADAQHWERISAIRKEEGEAQAALEAKKNAAITQGYMTFLGNLSGLMNTHSRKAFEVGKAAALTEASVKAAQGVMSAWSAGMSTGGPWAPVIAAGYAAAAAVNGANMINNIRKQQFGGTGVTPTAPTQGASNVTGGGAASDVGGPRSTLAVEGLDPNQLFSGKAVRELMERVVDTQRDGGKVVFI